MKSPSNSRRASGGSTRYRLGDAVEPGFEDLTGVVVRTGMAGWGTQEEPGRYFLLRLEVDEAAFESLDRLER